VAGRRHVPRPEELVKKKIPCLLERIKKVKSWLTEKTKHKKKKTKNPHQPTMTLMEDAELHQKGAAFYKNLEQMIHEIEGCGGKI